MTLIASQTCKKSVNMPVDWVDIMEGHVQLSEVTIFSKFKNNYNFCRLREETWASNFDRSKNIKTVKIKKSANQT